MAGVDRLSWFLLAIALYAFVAAELIRQALRNRRKRRRH
jgi:hypothetical protein